MDMQVVGDLPRHQERGTDKTHRSVCHPMSYEYCTFPDFIGDHHKLGIHINEAVARVAANSGIHFYHYSSSIKGQYQNQTDPLLAIAVRRPRD